VHASTQGSSFANVLVFNYLADKGIASSAARTLQKVTKHAAVHCVSERHLASGESLSAFAITFGPLSLIL